MTELGQQALEDTVREAELEAADIADAAAGAIKAVEPAGNAATKRGSEGGLIQRSNCAVMIFDRLAMFRPVEQRQERRLETLCDRPGRIV
jgi:hypothetical protein